MLNQRRRRCANIKSVLSERLMFSGPKSCRQNGNSIRISKFFLYLGYAQ